VTFRCRFIHWKKPLTSVRMRNGDRKLISSEIIDLWRAYPKITTFTSNSGCTTMVTYPGEEAELGLYAFTLVEQRELERLTG